MLADRIILITGIANERSLAAAAARVCAAAGARLVCTWQDEKRRPRVQRILTELQPDALCCRLDVTDPTSIRDCMHRIRERYGRLDGLLHAIAYAKLDADVCHCPQGDWHQALEISTRSLAVLAQTAQPLFSKDAAMCTLSYQGARQAVPGYGVMGVAKAALEASVRYLAAELGPQGVRVNAVAAGSVRTLAASGVPGFGQRLRAAAERAPLRRNIDQDEVAQAICWLLAPLSSGVTGQVLSVDAGASCVGG
ncbi:MAG: enoyl-ACP reductase FabI [Planctomycetota bacterium]